MRLRFPLGKCPYSSLTSSTAAWTASGGTPASGTAAIFNRLHDEDAFVVRVHTLVPRDVWWSKRYALKWRQDDHQAAAS
jgi:hypothetical protein